MANPLIPQQRVDKNGRTVTRHVKASQSPASSLSSAPPPTASGPAKTPKKKRKEPLAKQLKREMMTPAYMRDLRYDKELNELLKEKTNKLFSEDNLMWIKASQAEYLDVFAAVGIDNGLLILNSNLVPDHDRSITGDEVEALLTDNGMEHLIIDKKEMMLDALDRRIDPYSMIRLNNEYPMENYDDQVFLDAARLLDAGALVDASRDEPYHEALLKGEISYKDVEALGITFIAKGNTSLILDRLKKSHDGTLGYDMETLKSIASRHGFDTRVFEGAEDIVSRYGSEMIENTSLYHAVRTDKATKGMDEQYRREMLEYTAAAKFYVMDLSAEDLIKLHGAGLEADESCRMVAREGYTVDQVIEIKSEGIASSVARGWL